MHKPGPSSKPASLPGRHATAPKPLPMPAVTPWQRPGRPGEHLVLLPGQMHLGTQVASLRTLLGSCVAITLWHPQRRIGGMCHYLLPQRPHRASEPPDGRYGDEAVQAMVDGMRRWQVRSEEFTAHLYGGADTMPEGAGAKFSVGERNIEIGWSLIDRFGFQLQGVDVGEDIPRTVTLSFSDGEVEMRRGSGHAPVTALPPTPRAARPGFGRIRP